MEEFLATSTVLTGFSRFDLHATGLTTVYLELLTKAVGRSVLDELNRAIAALPADEPARDEAVRKTILNDRKLGPVARNLIKLWYLGFWPGMSDDWAQEFGMSDEVVASEVVSAEAYKEGLAWRAINAHPSGAKQQGFGAWSQPPEPEE